MGSHTDSDDLPITKTSEIHGLCGIVQILMICRIWEKDDANFTEMP